MARITVPEADAVIDEAFPVLDQGFVRLVDYMGGDARVVQAARVSYGAGTKTVREDKGLINYLMRNAHTSPFEMIELVFHIKLPLFVFAQMVRHRTACLAGDTQLFFDLPGAKHRARRHRHNVSIADFHRMWHEGTKQTISKKEPTFVERVDADRLYTASEMELRMCDEATGEIKSTKVVDVWESGVKPVFRVRLENGYTIKMTESHRCLTETGWQTLGDATKLSLRQDGGVTWDSEAPAFAVNGIPCYQDREWLAARRSGSAGIQAIADEAGVSYMTIRKWLRVYGLQFTAKERARLAGLARRGQKRQVVRPRNMSAETLGRMRLATSGARSPFWQGGVSTDREKVGSWTSRNARQVHDRNAYKCVICGSSRELHAHHVDPVWHSPEKAKDSTNLTTLCTPCRSAIHGQNLERDLLAWTDSKRPLAEFWDHHPEARPRPAGKERPRSTKLVRAFSKVASIEYAGEEMTYDLEVAGPYHNFVANGFIVHNSLNSMSARYSVMEDEFYLPSPEQIRGQSQTNKQVSEGGVGETAAVHAAEIMQAEARDAYAKYEEMLANGVGREQARMVLPQNLYTQIYWKCDLHNLFHFLRLRLDWHAQQEIRAYAEVMAMLAKKVAPFCYEAFEEHVLGAQRFGKSEVEALKRMLAGQPHGLEGRAATEFEAKLAAPTPTTAG
jgi:thymidylate synthase (FAD)